jgi:hypothetical protein
MFLAVKIDEQQFRRCCGSNSAASTSLLPDSA